MKSFFPSLALLVVLNLLVKPVWIFAIDRQVQNEVGTQEYGIYFSLLGLSVFLSFLSDWGLTVYFNRQLSTDPENFRENTGSFLLVKLLFSLLYALIVLAVANAAGIERWDILVLVIIIQVLTSFFVFLRNIVTAMQWFRTDAWLSVLDKTLMIILCGGFLYYSAFFGEISLELFLYIQVACTLSAIIVTIIILAGRKISFSFKKPYPGSSVFKATLPYALIFLLMSAHYRLDGFLLERLHPNGPYEAGIYAGAFRLLDAGNMIGFLFASFLLPLIANRLSKRKNIDLIVLQSRHLLVIFSMFAGLTVIFYGPWLHHLLYDVRDEDAIKVLQLCLPVLLAWSFINIYGTLLTARGLLIPFSYILFTSLTINIILNLALIPDLGALGCCISALISQSFCAIVMFIYASKKSAVDFHVRSLLIYIFIGLLIAAYYYLCRNARMDNWLVISLAGLLALTISVHFKLIDFKMWRKNAFSEEEENA